MTERLKTGELHATFSTPGAAKAALGDLCDRGVDAARIRLTDDSASRLRLAGSQRTADRRAVSMAARAVAVGIAGGAVVGLLLGLVLWVTIDVPGPAVMLLLALGGLIVGGLLGGIYRLKENRAWAKLLAVPDLDADLPVRVRVDPADGQEHDLAREVLAEHAEDVTA